MTDRAQPAVPRPIWWAVGAGAVVRCGVLAAKWNDPLLLNDSLWYATQAYQLIHGRGFADAFAPYPTAEHGPLTPLVLSPVSWGGDPSWQRLLLTVIGTVTVLLIGLIGVEIGGRRVGVIAAGIAAVYPNLWLSDSVVMAETPMLAALCGAILCLLRARRSDRVVAWLAACGLLLGAATLARSELLFAVPLFAWVAAATIGGGGNVGGDGGRGASARRALVLAVAALVPVVPWVARNLVVFERPVLLTTNDGTTLLGANCPDTYIGPQLGGWSLACVLGREAEAMPVIEEPSVRSARNRSAAVTYAGEHLERIPLVVAARLGRVLDVYAVAQQVDGDVIEDRDRWAIWLGVVAWYPLAVAAAFGARRVARRDRLLLATPVLVALAVAVVFYGSRRLRAPAEPVVVVCASLALDGLLIARAGRGATPLTL